MHYLIAMSRYHSISLAENLNNMLLCKLSEINNLKLVFILHNEIYSRKELISLMIIEKFE